MAIMALLIGGASVAIPAILAGGGVDSATSKMEDFLEYSRAQAMAKGTYVLVGFYQGTVAGTNNDELQLAAVISLDGTYNPNPGTGPNTTGFAQLVPIMHLPNMKLIPFASLSTSGSGSAPILNKLSQANINVDGMNTINCAGSTTEAFSFINNVATVNPTSASTTFSSLIAFSPQGEAILVTSDVANATLPSASSMNVTTPFYGQIFVGLRATRGGSFIQGDLNSAALIIDGGSGHAAVYRS